MMVQPTNNPRKPSKGFRFRIILIDEKGNEAQDDMKMTGKATHRVLDRLVAEIVAKQMHIQDPVKWSHLNVHYSCIEVEPVYIP